MIFDWVRFLESLRVDHELGPKGNVRRGHVGIHCPRCGGDTKYHFSIRIEDGSIRGCWRDPAHWMGPTELVSHLARVSWREARRLLEEADYPVEVNMTDLLSELEEKPRKRSSWNPATREWPREAHRFQRDSSRRQEPFDNYLRDRGFDDPQAVARAYGLRWADDGTWKQRILFPLRHESKLVGWTGRAISKARLRYRTFPEGEEAIVQHVVWNLREDDEGDLLILCEGPFDALKVDWYGGRRGVQAIALLGLSTGPKKHALLARAARRFSRMVILLDAAAEPQALTLKDQLAILRPEVGYLPPRTKDPGELSAQGVRRLLQGLLAGSRN